MANLPIRSKDDPSRNPAPREIRSLRQASELTQTQAGELLHTTCRVWQQWEAGDRRMHPAFFELLNLKLSHPTLFRKGAEQQ